MYELIGAFLLVVGLLICLADWRKGLFVCAAVGFLQDPLRKLFPGQPVYFVLLAAAFFGVVCLSALARGVRLAPSGIRGWQRYLRTPFALFAALVAIQAVHGLARYENPVITGIGFIVYLAPVPAFLVGYRYALGGRERVVSFLRWYAALGVVFVSGVHLEYLGVKWPVLGEIGGGFKIYDLGTVLKAYSGFMRTSEIAAWHAATCTCVLVILGARARGLGGKVLAGLGILLLVAAGVLTARRKMLAEVLVFAAAYWFLLAAYRRGGRKVAALAAAVGVAGFLIIQTAGGPEAADQQFHLYVMRGSSVFGDIPERAKMSVLGTIAWAYARFGFLGAGAGAGSQGAQHFGGGAGLVGGAPEGGLGKILTELGIPGVFLSLWLTMALVRHVRRLLRDVAAGEPGIAYLTFGLTALLIANAVTFLIATQAYGDPFVLLILGWMLGFVLAAPALQPELTEKGIRQD